MEDVLLIPTIIVSILIVVLTLFQGKGGGLGSAWGGTGAGFQTRRGLEMVLLRATGLLICVFFVLTVAHLVL